MKAPIITPHPMKPPDLPGGGATRLTRENHLPGRLPVRVTPETLNPCASRPNSNGIRRPKPPSTVSDGPCSHGLLVGRKPVREYRPVHPFDYACRPRLRTRLTQGRRTWPWNPWSSSGRDPHPALATHVCILTPTQSTAGFPRRFAPVWDALLPHGHTAASASSVACLSPATLSARNH